MRQRVLSIYIGKEMVRVADLQRNSAKSVTLFKVGEEPTPEGCVEDGQITDVGQMAEVIRKIIADKNLRANKLQFTIASKKIANKEVVLPWIKQKKKIREIVNACAPDYFPMSNVSDYLFSYSALDTVTEGEIKKLRLTAVAVPKEIVASYYELAKLLKMPVENIDYFGNSILQLLLLQMGNETELAIQIEKETTVVNIMKGKVLQLQRTVPFGQKAIVEAIMDIKKTREEEVVAMLQDQERLRRLVTDAEYDEAVSYMANSIGRVVEYYRSQLDANPIERVRLFGEEGRMAGFADYLAERLELPVSYIRDLNGVQVKYKDLISRKMLQKYLSNVGAALAPIGLILEEENAKKDKKNELLPFWVGLGVSAVAVLIMGGFTGFQYYQQNKVLQEAENRIASMAPAQKLYDEYSASKAGYDTISKAFDTTRSNNEVFYEFLLELEEKMPEDVQIDSISSDGGEINFSGTVLLNKDEIAELVKQLKGMELVSNVFLGNMTDTYTAEGEWLATQFSLSSRIRNPEIPEPPAETEQPAPASTEQAEEGGDET